MFFTALLIGGVLLILAIAAWLGVAAMRGVPNVQHKDNDSEARRNRE